MERTVSEDFSASDGASQTAGANAMRRDIRDFYELKRQRARRQRTITERDDKPMNEMKISHATTTKCVSAAKSVILNSLAYPLMFLLSLRRGTKEVFAACVCTFFLHDIPY